MALSQRIQDSVNSIPIAIHYAIDQIRAAEGDFNPVDRDKLPCLEGITARTWQWYVNTHHEFGTYLATKEQAADDLRAIAGRGGRAYTHIARDDFSQMVYDIAYQKYLVAPGFNHLQSVAVQQYIVELSYRRGEDSARWALAYAAGVEPRHAEPLMIDKDGVAVMRRGEARDHAIEYANGFMQTGQPWQIGTAGQGISPDDEQRFYARLRLASVVEESHMVGNRGFDNLALGLFKRAFEFKWMGGLSADDPGFDSNSADDKGFSDLYQSYQQVYDRYRQSRISRAEFNNEILTLAQAELCDPHSPMNARSQPSICQEGSPRIARLAQKLRAAEDPSAEKLVPANWPTNSEEGPRVVGGADEEETRGRLEDYAARHHLDVGAFVNYYRDNPDGKFPVIFDRAQAIGYQYARNFGIYGHKEQIALSFGNDSVIYEINRKGDFVKFLHMPKGMQAYVKTDGSGPPLIPYAAQNGETHFIPLSAEVNERMRTGAKENDYYPAPWAKGVLRIINGLDRRLNALAPHISNGLNAIIPWINKEINTDIGPAHLAQDLPTHLRLPVIPRNASVLPGVSGFRLMEGNVGHTIDDWFNSQAPRPLDPKENDALIVDSKLPHERFLVQNLHNGDIIGAPPEAIIPAAKSGKDSTPPR